MSEPQNRSDQPLSGWAVGGVGFAACMLVLIGAFQIVDGLAAIIDDQFFVVGNHYAFDLDTTVWGWIHLILGILLVLTGFVAVRAAAPGPASPRSVSCCCRRS